MDEVVTFLMGVVWHATYNLDAVLRMFLGIDGLLILLGWLAFARIRNKKIKCLRRFYTAEV